MKNPCLIVANGLPQTSCYSTEEAAVAAGRSWQETNDDPRWNVVDLECITVIWGDDEHTGAGVFNFSFVEMGEHSFRDKEFQPVEIARSEFYNEKILLDPEYFDYDDGDEAEAEAEATRTMSLEEYLETSFTLIAILPGRICELG